MILSDRDIRAQLEQGRVVVDPIDENAVQPSSIDLRVGDTFRVFANHRRSYIDVRDPMEDLTEDVKASPDEPFVLHPGEFVLGSTLERIELPDDLVGRVEGKSSLGRLGLLIHSSLPASEEILLLADGRLTRTTIGDVVKNQRAGSIVAFDPETFAVGYHDITGWYEGPEDRIFEVVLRSGRRVRVTAGHNLFTLDRDGHMVKAPTQGLQPGMRVAVAGRMPDPDVPMPKLDLLELVPDVEAREVSLEGPTVARLFAERHDDVATALLELGIRHVGHYERHHRLPWQVARQFVAPSAVTDEDRVRFRQSRRTLPPRIPVTTGLAWLLGLYVAEGYRRRGQAVVSNTDDAILDRVATVLDELGLPIYRSAGQSITCASSLFSAALDWIGCGGKARDKRVPRDVFGWPQPLLQAFVEGFTDGDGSREPTRDSLWTSSVGLVSDLLLVLSRLGRRAGVVSRVRSEGRTAHQVQVPRREHKLLTAVPLPDRLLVRLRQAARLSQKDAAAEAGYRHPTDLCNIETRTGRTAVRRTTLARLREVYARPGVPEQELADLDRLVDGDLLWDEVAEVVDTGDVETVYDLEVRPDGCHVENFLAGHGGVFVSNTAGFVDAGFQGHLTLELSNVANLPIAIYPGMRIGQLCLFRMTSPAERPYGSPELGSKYQGQQGPTPSRYFANFANDPAADPPSEDG